MPIIRGDGDISGLSRSQTFSGGPGQDDVIEAQAEIIEAAESTTEAVEELQDVIVSSFDELRDAVITESESSPDADKPSDTAALTSAIQTLITRLDSLARSPQALSGGSSQILGSGALPGGGRQAGGSASSLMPPQAASSFQSFAPSQAAVSGFVIPPVGSRNYYVQRDGSNFGPFDQGTVINYIRGHQLTGQDRIWHEGLSDFKPLKDTAEFQEALKTYSPSFLDRVGNTSGFLPFRLLQAGIGAGAAALSNAIKGGPSQSAPSQLSGASAAQLNSYYSPQAASSPLTQGALGVSGASASGGQAQSGTASVTIANSTDLATSISTALVSQLGGSIEALRQDVRSGFVGIASLLSRQPQVSGAYEGAQIAFTDTNQLALPAPGESADVIPAEYSIEPQPQVSGAYAGALVPYSSQSRAVFPQLSRQQTRTASSGYSQSSTQALPAPESGLVPWGDYAENAEWDYVDAPIDTDEEAAEGQKRIGESDDVNELATVQDAEAERRNDNLEQERQTSLLDRIASIGTGGRGHGDVEPSAASADPSKINPVLALLAIGTVARLLGWLAKDFPEVIQGFKDAVGTLAKALEGVGRFLGDAGNAITGQDRERMEGVTLPGLGQDVVTVITGNGVQSDNTLAPNNPENGMNEKTRQAILGDSAFYGKYGKFELIRGYDTRHTLEALAGGGGLAGSVALAAHGHILGALKLAVPSAAMFWTGLENMRVDDIAPATGMVADILTLEEVQRVLAPGGEAYAKSLDAEQGYDEGTTLDWARKASQESLGDLATLPTDIINYISGPNGWGTGGTVSGIGGTLVAYIIKNPALLQTLNRIDPSFIGNFYRALEDPNKMQFIQGGSSTQRAKDTLSQLKQAVQQAQSGYSSSSEDAREWDVFNGRDIMNMSTWSDIGEGQLRYEVSRLRINKGFMGFGGDSFWDTENNRVASVGQEDQLKVYEELDKLRQEKYPWIRPEVFFSEGNPILRRSWVPNYFRQRSGTTNIQAGGSPISSAPQSGYRPASYNPSDVTPNFFQVGNLTDPNAQFTDSFGDIPSIEAPPGAFLDSSGSHGIYLSPSQSLMTGTSGASFQAIQVSGGQQASGLSANLQTRLTNALKRNPQAVQQIYSLSQRLGIPFEDALSLAIIESDLVPTARSSVGASGITQQMPYLAKNGNAAASSFFDFAKQDAGRFGLTELDGVTEDSYDLFNQSQNLAVGLNWYRRLLVQYNGDRTKAMRAYNGGGRGAGPNPAQESVNYSTDIQAMSSYLQAQRGPNSPVPVIVQNATGSQSSSSGSPVTARTGTQSSSVGGSSTVSASTVSTVSRIMGGGGDRGGSIDMSEGTIEKMIGLLGGAGEAQGGASGLAARIKSNLTTARTASQSPRALAVPRDPSLSKLGMDPTKGNYGYGGQAINNAVTSVSVYTGSDALISSLNRNRIRYGG